MMKFNKNMVLFLSVFCVHNAVASPTNQMVNVIFTCPLITDHHNSAVKNYGQYLYGSGIEKHGNNDQKIRWFRGVAVIGLHIPMNLAENGYYNDGVNYNKESGAIVCRYNTTKGFDPFALTYLMPDALKGFVYYVDSAKIKIKMPKKPK